jgi:hypothetical protein
MKGGSIASNAVMKHVQPGALVAHTNEIKYGGSKCTKCGVKLQRKTGGSPPTGMPVARPVTAETPLTASLYDVGHFNMSKYAEFPNEFYGTPVTLGGARKPKPSPKRKPTAAAKKKPAAAKKKPAAAKKKTSATAAAKKKPAAKAASKKK